MKRKQNKQRKDSVTVLYLCAKEGASEAEGREQNEEHHAEVDIPEKVHDVDEKHAPLQYHSNSNSNNTDDDDDDDDDEIF